MIDETQKERKPNYVQLTDKTRIYNLTAHPITLFSEDGRSWEVPASGHYARRDFFREKIDYKHGLPVYDSKLGNIVITDWNGRDTNYKIYPYNIYLVSNLTLQGDDVPENFYAPGEPIRDKTGKQIGSLGLVKIPRRHVHTKKFKFTKRPTKIANQE